MNQDQNNLNQNFNTQGNNGMPNNQPLNNQGLNQSMSFNNQTVNSQQQVSSYAQPVMQEPTPQSTNNTFNSSNGGNHNFNSKQPKKMNVGLIIGIVVFIIAIILVSMFFINGNQNNNSNNDGIQNNNNIPTRGFYIISDSQDKGTSALSTNFASEKADNYNYIEKYNMKWVVGSKLYIMPVPVIPNRTYSLNGYATNMIEMKSDILNFDYNILEENIDKAKVDAFLQDTINEYSNKSIYKLSKNTGVVEIANTIGYAYSVKTFYSTQIRVSYYTKLNNNISSENYILSSFLTFDINDYDKVKPIVEELSNTLGFNIVDLIEQVK